MRELKFSLDVQSDAFLCPNPGEWYAGTYITENVANNFRTVPGVKEATKIGKTLFTDLIKQAGCSWDPVDTVLDTETIEVCKLDVMVQICQYDLESSFVSLKMAQGDVNWNETEFFNHYWDELSKEVESEIQDIRWNGDTDLSAGYLKECDGYLKLIEGASASTEFTGVTGSITKANIISILEGVVGSLPEAVIASRDNFKIYLSEKNAFLYQLATLGLNSNFNYTGTLPLSFAGYEIAVQPGMDDAYIVAGLKTDLVYAFDGEGDAKNLKIVNMIDTTAEPVIRTRVGLKVGFKVLNDGVNIAYYAA